MAQRGRGLPVRWLVLAHVVIAGLRYEPLRSALVVGAVAMGVTAMAVVLALGRGAGDSIASGGTEPNLLTAAAGQVRALPARGGGWYRSTTLDLADVESLGENLTGVRAIGPMLEGTRLVELRGRAKVTSVRGVEPDYLRMRDFTIAAGRPLDALDGEALGRVAVAGMALRDMLAPDAGLVGARVSIGGVPFDVVGELAAKGVSVDGANQDDQILIPLETAARRVFNVDYLTAIFIEAETPARAGELVSAAGRLLRENHRLAPGVGDDFELLLPLRAGELGAAQANFVRGLARIVSIAMLAFGALGVLVVTYLNISDRTTEVGLRRAIGARRRDIAALFLAEACALTTLGGVCGVVLALVALVVAGGLTSWPLELGVDVLALPLLVSAGCGVVFGAAPAVRAARLEPVHALGAG